MGEFPAPLIVTLKLDDDSFERFDALRRRYFPPERNLVPAHLTLFHHLPETEMAAVAAILTAECWRQPPMIMTVCGLRFLGRGVAYTLAAPELEGLRGRLAEHWKPWLTEQDRQGFRPHVTIQNKVSPAEARLLYEQLSAGFEPFPVNAEGVLLWRYLRGPWDPLGDFPFQSTRRQGQRLL